MSLKPHHVRETVAPFLDGLLSSSASDAVVAVTNPSNGRHLITIPAGCEEDVDRAVASSRRAFEDGRWGDLAPSARKKVLHRLADLIAAESAQLDALDAGEMGKPVSTVYANATAAAEVVRFNAEAVDKIMGDVYGSDKHSFAAQRRVPRGVVAAVVPWNFPTFNAMYKVAPALAAGNCVVLKPSEFSSRSAIRLGKLALQAGLPQGVLNVVPGLGETVGQALGMHEDVNMVAFTGSTAVGKLMLQYSGRSNMKVVQAECGGKSPQIVFADGVDLDAASEWIAGVLLTNQGQLCSTGSRLLVHRSISQLLTEKVLDRMKRVHMGDALDPETTFGPLVSAKQCARVVQYIEDAQAEGAQLALGGRRVMQESGGYFVEPTVFCDVEATARIAQEEIFGPVLSVIPFDEEDEAIKIANGTMYGLVAYVWTADLSRGMRVAKAIRSTVLVNAISPHGEGAGQVGSAEPAGQSGVGVEGGIGGIESYLRRQLVSFSHA